MTFCTFEGVRDDTRYESDFAAWVERQAALLRSGQLSELDRENLLEELESLGANDHHEVRSRLIVLIAHLLKCKYQPQRKCRSWFSTISEQRDQIALRLERSPSMRRFMDGYAQAAYRSAVTRAAFETGLPASAFPATLPFSLAQVQDLDVIP